MELDKILPKDGPSIKEAEKYIDKYKNEYICIKVGGSVLNDKSLFKFLLEDISILKKLNLNPILIHGGGKKLTNKLNELNIQTDFIDGLRITNQKVVSIAEDVFIKFNKEIVDTLKNNSSNAVGITSKENNIINVETIKKELGFVGTPNKIDVSFLKKIIEENKIPVIAPLGLDSNNQVYNVNADEVGTSIASALSARRLLIVSNVKGVMKKNNLISEINSTTAEKMLVNSEISGGMVPKVKNAISIADKVKGIVIISGIKLHSILFELFSDKGSGTLIRK
tara:strand:- start:610 stop:1452 length:843 start_codon:yes stop_codon:yes gene_type:complete